MSNENSNVRAAIELTERLAEAEFLQETELLETGLVVIPQGKQVVDLRKLQDARLEKPRRIAGESRHTTLDSFVAHVNRFKDDRSAIFADDTPKKPKLTAIYDYHQRHGEPRFGSHRAVYDFPLSDEWLARFHGLVPAGPFAPPRELREVMREDRARVGGLTDVDGGQPCAA